MGEKRVVEAIRNETVETRRDVGVKSQGERECRGGGDELRDDDNGRRTRGGVSSSSKNNISGRH